MSEIVFPTYSNPLDVSSPLAQNNPLGKESTFYTPKVVVSNSYDSSSSNLGDINCHFAYFKSGFDVIERYNLLKNKLNTEDEYRESIGLVDANSLNILYEDHTEVTGKSNLFGTSCRVLMGKKTAKFIQGIIESKASFFLNDVLFDFYNLSKFVEEIVEQENKKNPNLQSKINATIVEAAILIEYHKVKEKNFFEEIIEGLTTGLRDKLVELIFDASDELESFKFTSANYEPSNPNFSPVIPIKITKKILEGGLKKLIEAGDSFGNFIIAIADLLGTVFPVFKIISEQLELLFKLLRQFADKIIKAIEKGLLWANAFLCGLCNGFISLLQSVLVLAGFVFKIQPIGTGVPTSPAKLAAKLSEYQIWAEFAEDTVEAFIDSIPKILNGIVNSIEYVVTHLEEVFSKISDFVGKGIDIAQKGVKKAFNSLANKTQYWWAFIAGAFIFEVIVEIILLLLTGGTAAVAKEVARISRAIKKTGKTVAKAAAKTVDVATTALRAIKKLFDEMFEAINNGRFIEWVKGKLDELLGIKRTKPAKQDLLERWDGVAISGRDRNLLGQLLLKEDLIKIENKLKQLGCEFDIFPSKGEFDVGEDFVDKLGNHLKLPELKIGFFYTDKKMKMALREGATVYDFFHEFMHLQHSKKLGLKKYNKLGGAGTPGGLIKEINVFDKVIENKELFTRDEISHALRYINKELFLWGKNPVTLKFDLNKIPKVRKEVNIETILNKK